MRVTVTVFKDKSVKSYIANLAHRSDHGITLNSFSLCSN